MAFLLYNGIVEDKCQNKRCFKHNRLVSTAMETGFLSGMEVLTHLEWDLIKVFRLALGLHSFFAPPYFFFTSLVRIVPSAKWTIVM